ncbi:MAG: PSD1 and planctomycete cytochrome C domain-containing protein [Verrucomicrobiota bacterium]
MPLLSLFLAASTAAPLPDKVDFNRDVRPILSENCFYCHGPDASHRKAKLRLDLRDAALAKEAFIPGKPEESELSKRLDAEDPEERMPPADSHKKLDDRQKAVLRKWIAQGAEYRQHWSYEPPVKPSAPAGSEGVDHLVEAGLKPLGLTPGPEADRRTLARRLHLDLLGLPPTPEEVDAFVKDASPDAYPRLVERLLASPHYGERMAITWLDVVRFADTIGYHSDTPRNIWPYRDWVIRSFNDNKPFDRFTLEQVAGDLLPDGGREALIGSGFNRLLLTTEEGGAQAKDYQQRMLTDRVRAVGAAWLGQTTGCAQCHDHKFDPITMRDFYSLGAFFADVHEPDIGRREEGILVSTPEQDARLAELAAAVAQAHKKLEAAHPSLTPAIETWEKDFTAPETPGKKTKAKRKDPDAKLAAQAAPILKKPADKRTPADRNVVRDYYLSLHPEALKTERDALAAAEKSHDAFRAAIPKTLVTAKAAQTRTVRILPRGNWMDETGEIVKAALPHYLPQPKLEGRAPNRLDLAQWLVSRDNPLTARVTMNRLWMQFFGTALSKNPGDLGAQGELPPNQPLLDWLAVEFMDGKWDLKRMVRIIVNSRAYRRASTATQAQRETDPYNRALARQTPFRLDAEFVRDNALAVSGLLVPKVGGPSVKPYQPERYWENLNFPVREYVHDQGEAQHRRGLYVWWQRSFLHPSLLAFDAPSREESCTERTRSNIPQQALVLLNDPTYVEAARAFGTASAAREGDDDARLRWAWRRAVQREPNAAELGTLRKVLNDRRAAYRADPESAKKLLQVGLSPAPKESDPVELAAWTHAARVLLNLHETVTRD